MDDKSLWKKELSSGRKPKEQNDADESTADDEKPASAFKQELSFKRKETADAVDGDAVADAPAEEPAADEPQVDEPVAAEPVAAEPEVAEETVWKKEVSFARKGSHEDEAAMDEVAKVDQSTDPPEQLSDPEAEPDEKVWKKEVSFSRASEAEPVVEQFVDDEAVVEQEPVAEAEPVAVAEPVAEASVEPWDAPPVLPPAPVVEPLTAAEPLTASVPEPMPSEVVHAPVAAADLPPLIDEDAPKVPFWKKELSLGGKNGEKPAKERKQKAPKVKAERAEKTKEPKEPKPAKQPKERKQKTPKVKAERGNAKGRLIGLKIGASQLAAAHVANNGSAELLQVAREPLAPGIIVGGELRDPDALAEALKDFFAKNGLPKKGVRLGIANNRIGVRTFEIAGIEDQKQLANAIRFRAQETLPIPIDEAVLDYQVLGEGVGEDGQPTKRILLVVAYRELIDRYVDACKKAGITLVGIDLEAFALLRALQAPQEGVGTDAAAALVVVAIGHERSTFAVSDGRVCEFTRVLEWGGSALNVAIARAVDAAPSEVENTKRALSLMDEMVPDGITADQAKNARESMRRAIQTFARELVSSLQYYQNQPGSLGIGEIVLTGGTAHLPGLAGELERLIGVHVRVGDPLARMKVSKKVGQPEQIGSLAVAIGLGIED